MKKERIISQLNVAADCESTLRLLLKNGANPNSYVTNQDGSKTSPLYHAIQAS